MLLRGWGLLNQGPGEASAPLESGGLCPGLRPPLPAASVPGSPAGRCLWPSAPGAQGGTNGGPESHGAQTWNTRSPQVPQGSIFPHFMSRACLLGKPENKTAGPSPTVKTVPRPSVWARLHARLVSAPGALFRLFSLWSWSTVFIFF